MKNLNIGFEKDSYYDVIICLLQVIPVLSLFFCKLSIDILNLVTTIHSTESLGGNIDKFLIISQGSSVL